MESSTSPLSGLYIPTQLSKLYYGPSTVSEHLVSCLPTSSSKAYIITGSSLSKTPLISDVEKTLGDHHAGTFARIGQHAPVADIDAATDKVLADEKIDTIISIGGGSPIDSAKLISYRWNERRSSSSSSSSSPNDKGKYLHHIAIPTTLSAAECSGGAGYTDSSGLKTGVFAPGLVPSVVLYDAHFISHTPPHLFLSTGLRALDHALETLYHPTATDLTRSITVAAAGDLFAYLPKYKADPHDETAVTKLQLAAFASLGFLGLNLKGGLGLSHALGYALGSPYSIPHGVTSCLTLGKVVQLKAKTDKVAAGQIVRACEAVGVKRTGDDQADAINVGKAVESLVERLGLKTDLNHYKVDKSETGTIVKNATRQTEGPVFDAVKGVVETLW
ncbi:Dehydroquinate synthase-like protein [Myriangium duriaei CBS 260.36]|uniref:Dehydroquinate synthase-like protein n=1 Tax=Myriangium duriaei CBS 260.36 TaxID=1168546 RepID=A0A9P4IZX7_9PEZI|nr:Dehydroquinate synthase-like protein [Myriangium duriaei CBS 260.36]